MCTFEIQEVFRNNILFIRSIGFRECTQRSNMLNDTYSSRLPLCRKWLALSDRQPRIDCNERDFLWGEDREWQIFFFFFWRSNLCLRVSSKQQHCNGDDWFSAVVSGQPAISQNENQYVVPFAAIGGLGEIKRH